MILPVYKPLGSSSHQLARLVGERWQQKATHTGTLDPMAEGVLTVLVGQDRFLKSTLNTDPKEYLVEIAWGISTDSHDLLGLITSQHLPLTVDSEQLQYCSRQLVGRYHQSIPDFSAKRIHGTSYFQLAKQQQPTPLSTEQITIHSLKLLDTHSISITRFYQQVQDKLSKVQGDFRQQTVLAGWDEWHQSTTTTTPNQQITISRHTVTCSKRTYIRALVRDLAQLLDSPATVFSLVRTKNNGFTVADCICLV